MHHGGLCRGGGSKASLEPRGCLSPVPAMVSSAALEAPAEGSSDAATPQQPPKAAAEQAGSAQEGLQLRGLEGLGRGCSPLMFSLSAEITDVPTITSPTTAVSLVWGLFAVLGWVDSCQDSVAVSTWLTVGMSQWRADLDPSHLCDRHLPCHYMALGQGPLARKQPCNSQRGQDWGQLLSLPLVVTPGQPSPGWALEAPLWCFGTQSGGHPPEPVWEVTLEIHSLAPRVS